MIRLTRVEIYKSEDTNYNYDPLQEYLYKGDELVLQGDAYHNNVSEMIVGAIAMLDALGESYQITKIKIADSELYYKSVDNLLNEARNYDRDKYEKTI